MDTTGMTPQERYEALRAEVTRLAAEPQAPGVVYEALRRSNEALRQPGVISRLRRAD